MDEIKVLIGWDDAAEAETIELILNVNGMAAVIATDAEDFRAKAGAGGWDVLVMSLSFPTHENAFPLFESLMADESKATIIGAWHQGDIVHLAKFISAGLYSHLMRDEEGSFIMLLRSMIEAAMAGVQAQRARLLAERLREEVDSVRRLQENVIPQNLPEPSGYAIAARYEPSQIRLLGSNPVAMAGGDYYDVFQMDASNLILLVGDASGHGVKACMSIMTMHTLIRMIRSSQFSNTADFVAEINRSLSANQIVHDEGGFITLLYSTLDVAKHRLAWTSAGAPIPLLQNLKTNEIKLVGEDDDGGLPLAIDEDWEYQSKFIDIPEHSRLLIYTDGLDEAFPQNGNEDTQFGLDGIINSLKNTVNLTVEQALQKLFDDSNNFTQGAGRTDDTSVVLLERK